MKLLKCHEGMDINVILCLIISILKQYIKDMFLAKVQCSCAALSHNFTQMIFGSWFPSLQRCFLGKPMP